MTTNDSALIIRKGTILTPLNNLSDYDILVINNRIEKIGKKLELPNLKNTVELDAKDKLVSPGLIDSHTHGGNGFDFMTATVEQIQQLLKWYASNGVTSVFPTLSAALIDEYHRCCNVISEVRKEGEQGARIQGIHVEGPYISPEKKGAQPMIEGNIPPLGEIKDFISCNDNQVRIVTMAPEIPNGLELVDFLISHDIIASVGHSNARYEDVQEAVKHGLSRASHTFNGMSGLHHRKPGVVGAVMVNDNIYAEITLDGHHVHPGAAKALLKAKGLDKIVLITDSMQAAGLGDGEFIRPGNRKIFVKDGAARLESGNLAGSVLTLNQAVVNATKFLDIPLLQAVQMASLNAARSTGISDIGKIIEGNKADLIIHDTSMKIIHAIIDGKIIYSD